MMHTTSVVQDRDHWPVLVDSFCSELYSEVAPDYVGFSNREWMSTVERLGVEVSSREKYTMKGRHIISLNA